MSTITICKGTEKIALPVLPESFTITDSWDNHELNINSIGAITMIGKRGLKSITINSFFPNHNYSFLEPGSTIAVRNEKVVEEKKVGKSSYEITTKNVVVYDPWVLIKRLQSWRGSILTLFISNTDGVVSWPCVIDGDFTYEEKDGSGDVYYTLTLKEYKKTNTKRTVKTPTATKSAGKGSGLGGMHTTTKKYTTKNGDTLKKIARKLYGISSKAKTIYKSNKKAVEKGFKKYKKTLSKAEQKKYKKKSKYNKPLPKGVKLTVKIS